MSENAEDTTLPKMQTNPKMVLIGGQPPVQPRKGRSSMRNAKSHRVSLKAGIRKFGPKVRSTLGQWKVQDRLVRHGYGNMCHVSLPLGGAGNGTAGKCTRSGHDDLCLLGVDVKPNCVKECNDFPNVCKSIVV